MCTFEQPACPNALNSNKNVLPKCETAFLQTRTIDMSTTSDILLNCNDDNPCSPHEVFFPV